MLTFKIFKKAYFDQYQRWFKDDQIKNALYDIDEEWLEYILNDNSGVEYAIFSELEMVAEVGIVFPTFENPFYVINNIAINPTKFRKGIGSKVINELFELHPLKENEYWVAFVEEDNIVAYNFFKKNGWAVKTNLDMIRFEKRPLYIK